MTYKPTLESIQRHTVPDWFHDAKLGIFVHWGLYSIPAWAPLTGELGKVAWDVWFTHNPYAEWYLNTIRIESSPSRQHHVDTYGKDFSYFDFVPTFNETVQKWDPNSWANLFHQVGARYVVLTTKHHDGFLLWPSAHPNPFREKYYAQRDLVGELTDAVRAQGLKMGLYYSGGIDWTFNKKVIQDIRDLQAAVPQGDDYITYANAHWHELIARYRPSVMWNDIAYPAAANLDALFAHYYNNVPEGVINDRFTQRFEFSEGQIAGSRHYDFRTPEYASFDEITEYKWEATRGIGFSFGYNRNEGPDSYLSVQELIHSFVDIVSKNGNLLLNIGPMADGTIPDMQRERLLGLGQWLEVNGEAIFGTRPWVRANGQTDQAIEMRFTQKDGTLYAILLGKPVTNRVQIAGLRAQEGTTIHMLGQNAKSDWRQGDNALTITLPDHLPESPAYTFKITPAPLSTES
ncbi:MAG: alpha-L-fucosidase [Anaerolineae bacterium]|nr:alpha-L-fucosidase [Anaerolineae bacterium]